MFRPQFSRRRVTEIQRDSDGKAIVSWGGFDGLDPSMARKKNANAALIVAAVNALPALLADTALYRDIFAEITAKAEPLCEDENDTEKITGYRLAVGPLHRAAGKTGFQMFDGEKHLAAALADRKALLEAVERIKAKAEAAANEFRGKDRALATSFILLGDIARQALSPDEGAPK